MANGKTKKSRTGEEAPARAPGLKPILFVLDPSSENDKDLTDHMNNLEGAPVDIIKLWVMGYIQNVFVKNTKANDLLPHRSDFEGCLVEPEKREVDGKLIYPWAGLYRIIKSQEQEYQFFFSTISLQGLDIKSLFNKYCVPGGSQGSSGGGPVLNADKTEIFRPYEIIGGSGSMQDHMLKYHIVKIPIESMSDKNTLGRLKYWEAIIFHNSESIKVKTVRDSINKNQASPEDLEDVKKDLKTIRGKYVIGYEATALVIREVVLFPGDTVFIDENDNKTSNYENLPYLMFDHQEAKKVSSTGLKEKFKYLTHETEPLERMQGPFWIELDYFHSEDPAKTKVKLNLKTYKMAEAEASEEKLPFAVQDYPSVLDTQFFQIFDTSSIYQLFLSKKFSERNLKRAIKQEWNNQSNKKGIPDKVVNNFYFGYGGDRNECLLDAFRKASTFWKYRVTSDFDDVMKSELAQKTLTLSTHVKFSFDTRTDAYSESLAPLHVYSQIKSWWEYLSEEDKINILNCNYITVQGFASEMGDEIVNEPLRRDRAWKTAKSLWWVLRKEFKSSFGKKTLLEPQQSSQSESQKFVPANKKEVSILYWGQAGFPTHIALTPHANMHVLLTQDKKIVETAIKNHFQRFRDDNPDHRVAIVSFIQVIPAYVEQYMEEEIRLVTANPICAYRVLHHHAPGGSEPSRILLYILEPRWI